MNITKLRTALELEERELENQLVNVRRALHHLGVCGSVVKEKAA